MSPRPEAEVISDGRGEALAPEVWRRLRARPGLLAAVVALGLLAAGGAVAVVAPRLLPDLSSPRVTFTADEVPMDVDPWQSGADGRPLGPVILPVAVSVGRTDRENVDVHLIGLAGPGVAGADSPPVRLVTGVVLHSRLRAVLDCRAAPARDGAGPIGLLVRVGDGDRHRDVVVPPSTGTDPWGAAVRLACASWTARRELTVTGLVGRPHPTLTNVDLTVTVANAGPRAAVLVGAVPVRGDLRLSGALPIRVPAGGSVTIQRTVVLDRCDAATTVPEGAVPDGPGTTAATAATTDLINLAALAGEPPAAASELQPWYGTGEGRGPTGVVLTPTARAALTSALRAACGGVGPLVTLLAPESVRYDHGRRELTASVLVDLTPGLVRSLDVYPEADQGNPDAYIPLWTTKSHLVPDPTGQVRLALRYRAPPSGHCPGQGAFLPTLVVELRVPDRGGERLVRLSGFVDLTGHPAVVALLCTDGT